MGDAKSETVVEKKAVQRGDGTVVGKLRLQAYDRDEVHVHDDAANFVFVYKGRRAFQLGVDHFMRHAQLYDVGAVIMIRCDEAPAQKGRTLADLLLTLGKDGWELSLTEKGKTKKVDDTICDKTLAILDDFAQRL